ncbi:hypothetical protein [Rhodococcus globerulus]|uniref:Uncharacterized protein n=1 Tax=Rhodococcus globerulus TaxID=33008 RepID=A0ABU4C2C3_RHOGO|nr:hypothetical protein [Rhodococcus globerulus]MDV6270644.1 hypothetical protein [Rhodococcus globerulus]
MAIDAFAGSDPDTFAAFGQLLKGAYFLALGAGLNRLPRAGSAAGRR